MKYRQQLDLDELRAEFPPIRYRSGCSDRMCGATDCPTCHPDIVNDPIDETDDDSDSDDV